MKYLILCCLLVSLFPLRSYCEENAAPDARPSQDDLQSFVDSFVQQELKAFHIPGAVVVIVSDGQIVLSRGYGFANLQQRTRIKPNRTLFRMGSITKLFTTTAILQLSEQGKLNLKDDVNRYLKTFQIDNPFPEPVRVFHLLTHTAGFDERNVGTATLREKDVIPLGKYLAERMPPCVRAPGDLISYSNHGFTLAGYLVQLISGMPYEEYVTEHVLKPLGMNRSAFHLSKDDADDLATGYRYENRQEQAVPLDYVNDGPADGLLSTSSDMAKFMIASLQQGKSGKKQILRPETMEDMQRQHFTHYPGMAGWCYGYYEMYRNNLRALVHDGEVYGFTGRLYLIPEKNFGFFVATNVDTNAILQSALAGRLLDYCFPTPTKRPQPDPSPEFFQRAKLYEGYYRHTCDPVRTLEKLEVLMGFNPEIQVSVNPDATLTIGQKNFVEVEPLLLEQTNGRSFAAFRKNQQGAMTHLFLEQDAFEKIRWYETNRFQIAFAGSCVILFFLAIAVWIVKLLRRRPGSGIDRLYRLSAVLSAVNLIFVGILFQTFLRKPVFELSYAIPLALKVALILPLLSVILTICLLAMLFHSWRTPAGALIERIHFSVIAVAAVAFVWILQYWNLLGFRY